MSVDEGDGGDTREEQYVEGMCETKLKAAV
jgi:hypothetical protein